MTKNEYIASIMLEAAELLKNDSNLNEGIIDNIKNLFKRKKNNKFDSRNKENNENKEDVEKIIKNKQSNDIWKKYYINKKEIENDIVKELDKIKLPERNKDELRKMSDDELIKLFIINLKFLINKINTNSAIINKCKKIVDMYIDTRNSILDLYDLDDKILINNFKKFKIILVESDEIILVEDEYARFALGYISYIIGCISVVNLLPDYLDFDQSEAIDSGTLYILIGD